MAIAQALGGETDLDRILDLIVKRARALVGARTLVIVLEQDEELVFTAAAGELPLGIHGQRMPIEGTVTGQVLRSRRSERLIDARAVLSSSQGLLGLEADTALLVTLAFRGRSVRVLAAFDDLGDAAGFDDEDERLLSAFAASAATAVATGKSVEERRLRENIAASEQERRRWARELHDETLQSLAGLRVGLSAAPRGGEQQLRVAHARAGHAGRGGARDADRAHRHDGPRPPPGATRGHGLELKGGPRGAPLRCVVVAGGVRRASRTA